MLKKSRDIRTSRFTYLEVVLRIYYINREKKKLEIAIPSFFGVTSQNSVAKSNSCFFSSCLLLSFYLSTYARTNLEIFCLVESRDSLSSLLFSISARGDKKAQ